MAPKVTTARTIPATADGVVLFVAADGLSPSAEPSIGLDPTLLAAQGFTGGVDQSAFVTDDRGRPMLVVGLGDADSVDPDRLRRAAARAVRGAARMKRVAIDARGALGLESHTERVGAARAIAEGVTLGAYAFDAHRSKPPRPTMTTVTIVGAHAAKLAEAVEQGTVIGAAQNWARDLVNRPGGELLPATLANEARRMAKREGLTIEVMGPAQIRRLGLGGLLGVNRGSTHEPRFVKLTYAPTRPKGTIALVGKGITFDSGGLSIKTGEGMMTMKMDMGGAAAVLGCFAALGAIRPACRVVGYIPITDNMSDGDATRPGDVLTIRNGTTVEVLNTDAEGRLILADALSLATEAKPDAIVDLATLTGAVEIALGGRIAAVMANDDGWRDEIEAAAARAGERLWPLPLPADYRPFLDSDVADLRNISKSRGGGTITAGLFLQEFVGEGIPWAHIDIAATAWSDADDAEISRGGTGYGVRTLVELVRTFSPPRRR